MDERKAWRVKKKKADYYLIKTLSLFCDFYFFSLFKGPASCETVISILPLSVTH